MPARRGIAPLADIPDGGRRDSFAQPVIRREHPVKAMPVLAWRRDEIIEPVGSTKPATGLEVTAGEISALAGEALTDCHG